MMQNFEIFSKEKIDLLAEETLNSWMFSPLAPLKIRDFSFLTIPVMKSGNIQFTPVFTFEKTCPYPKIKCKSEKFFSSYFYSGRALPIILNPQSNPKTLSLIEIAALIGALQKKSSKNAKSLHVSVYESAEHKDPIKTAKALTDIGFYNDASAQLNNLDSQEALLLKSRISRLSKDIKKAGEFLAKITDEKLKNEKYAEYAILLSLSGKTAESNKIFSAIEKESETAAYEKAVNILSTDEQNVQSLETLKKIAAKDNDNSVNALVFLGSLLIKKGNHLSAIDAFSKAYALNGSLHFLSSIGYSMAKKGEFQEAFDIAAFCGAFNANFGFKILSELPADFLKKASYKGEYILHEEGKDKITTEKIEIIRETPPPDKPKPPATVSMEPADISKRVAAPSNVNRASSGLKFESNIPEAFSDNSAKNSMDKNKEKGFLSKAFSFCSRIEEEQNKKVYFNFEGLTDMERDLRLYFARKNIDQFQLMERVKEAGAFICYMMKERYKARLVELKDFDEWAWPCVINIGEKEFITYPVARVWNISWTNQMPDQGWAVKYFQYIASQISQTDSPQGGANAVKNRIKSHPEKIFDAQIEHKRMFTLASTLDEISQIEISRTGALKIDREIKKRFQPQTPPTADGWRLLRCYAHTFAQILIKDFKGEWFNVEKNDGLWSMELPWRTYIFPIGKVFKSAASGDNLAVYYDNILAEKLKQGKL